MWQGLLSSGNVAPWLCLSVLGIGLFVLISVVRRGAASRCGRCRELNRPAARFCAHCGAPLR